MNTSLEEEEDDNASETDSTTSTVQTDDDEFSDFIESQWKDNVEIGLVIRYPLPSTQYLVEDPSSLSEKTTTLPVLKLSTVLKEEAIAPLFDGTQWAGTRVWKAAVLGLEYLIGKYSHSQRGISLLELGCGLGLPSMVWKRWMDHHHHHHHPSAKVLALDHHQQQQPTRVILTDMESLLPQLQENIETNFGKNANIRARALDWSKEGITNLLQEEGGFWDVCLNCDCVYEPLYGRKAWESLADVLIEIAQVSPKTLLVTALERRKGDNVEGFVDRILQSGCVSDMERVIRDTSDPHHVIEIYVAQGIIFDHSSKHS